MPSEPIANDIRRSLAPSERYADFAYMYDALMLLRRPYHEDLRSSERIGEWLMCVLFPDKPRNYISAMQQFRLGFAGIATNNELQAEFFNSVRQAAIVQSEPISVWTPSLYFSPPPRLRDLNFWY
jgi:hypothetical protein